MTIWVDMTNSLQAKNSGVVDIIRTELELARNLHMLDSSIRYCVCEEDGFQELQLEELEWLFEADNVIDEYNRHNQRLLSAAVQKEEERNQLCKEYPGLASAYSISDRRIKRLSEAIKQGLSLLPWPLDRLLFIPARVVYKILLRLFTSEEVSVSAEEMPTVVRAASTISRPASFAAGDVYFSCGWLGSKKEKYLSEIRHELEDFRIIYTVYDVIVLKPEYKHLYSYIHDRFSEYVLWISDNCDKILYGGRIAQADTEAYYYKNRLRIPAGVSVRWGNNITTTDEDGFVAVQQKYDIAPQYIMAVGMMEPRKNYKTLYRAYCYLVAKYSDKTIPDLVIVGSVAGNEQNLMDKMLSTPGVKQKLRIISPSDAELDTLYRNCLFIVFPSLYEGWDLALTEGLNYGKLCLCADVAPLREIAGEIAVFVDPIDARQWGELIIKFTADRQERGRYESLVREKWHIITWADSARQVYNELLKIPPVQSAGSYSLYYDITLIVLAAFYNGSVSGILRTELLLLRLLSRKYAKIKYFSFMIPAAPNKEYYEFSRADIAEILTDGPVDEGFQRAKKHLIDAVWREGGIPSDAYAVDTAEGSYKKKCKNIFWLISSLLPVHMQRRFIIRMTKLTGQNDNLSAPVVVLEAKAASGAEGTEFTGDSFPFRENDIVFSAGCGFEKIVYEMIAEQRQRRNFHFVQLIYDYTPIIVPQTHTEAMNDAYEFFLNGVNKCSDILFFGGATAMRDGIKYQQMKHQKIRPSHVVKFGSNIVTRTISLARADEILSKYKIQKRFILTVGTLEARKNHEILYDAYLKLLNSGVTNLPQLVMCGYPGWKTGDFLQRLDADERVRGLIIHGSFSDEELDILYKKCLFTVLPSLYEGWSLTLPESLNYGKFCIASNADPLKETGRDFIDYANSYDVNEWAEKIRYYAENPEVLAEKEAYIRTDWRAISWDDCAEDLIKAFDKLYQNGPESFTEGAEYHE